MERDQQVRLILLQLKNRGLESDFKQLYHLLYDRFFRIVVYYLKNEEWTQEVVLDAFLTLWQKRMDLSDIDNFEGYYFIMLKNAALNYLNKAQKHAAESLDIYHESITENTPEKELLNDELLLVYVRALDDLPPKCREVFILIREQGLSYKEVAEQLNISVKTVDAQLQKAVSRLKIQIKEYIS